MNHATYTVEPCALIPFLPQQHSEIAVRYSDGSLAFRALPWQISTLARKSMVGGRVYKGRLCYAVLLVHMSTAMRVLRTEPAKASEVTHARQSKGAKHWVARHDRSKGGRTGTTARLVHDAFEKHTEVVPGTHGLVAERRVVGEIRQQFKAVICSEEML